jgi:hypothetical protein
MTKVARCSTPRNRRRINSVPSTPHARSFTASSVNRLAERSNSPTNSADEAFFSRFGTSECDNTGAIESLEIWSRSEPHRQWWQEFLRDSGGTGFWHETYFRRGGIEAVYVDMKSPTGLARFAPVEAARGAMFSARKRAGVAGEAGGPEAVSEEEFYQ